MPLQTEVFLQRRHLHEELLHTEVSTQTYFYMISDGKHQFCAKKFSKQVPNQNFTTSLDDLDAFCAKGFCARKQSVNFFFFSNDRNAFIARGSRHNHPNAKNSNFTAVLTIETQRGFAKAHFGSFRGSRRISWERVDLAYTHTATSLSF